MCAPGCSLDPTDWDRGPMGHRWVILLVGCWQRNGQRGPPPGMGWDGSKRNTNCDTRRAGYDPW